MTESVAFVRGIAYQETFRDPIANCTATFMLGARGFTGHGKEVDRIVERIDAAATGGGQPC